MRKLKIAIIGSGISGLSASWVLAKKYNIDLYEKNSYFGGHANTVNVKLKSKSEFNVDTGFIVFNEINYPNLCKLFDELDVKTYSSDMSFSASINNGKLEYSGSNFASLFAQKKNIININFLKMLFEIVKFYNNVENDSYKFQEISIEEYLQIKKYSRFFKHNHIYPMASSIWSSSLEEIKKYPFKQFVNFFSNHGLLRLINRPKWKTVLNGSQEYVKKIISNPKINAIKNVNAKIINFKNNKVVLKIGESEIKYDHLILATHSDQVKEINKIINFDEKIVFDDIKYTKNQVYLHTDNKFMPKIKKAWASWNYLESDVKGKLSVTYWMNKLQKLNTKTDIFVTLNPYTKPETNKIIKKILYHHPLYDKKTFAAQKKISLIQGRNNIWYCGAYLGYGFHEDGIRSGIDVANRIMRKYHGTN